MKKRDRPAASTTAELTIPEFEAPLGTLSVMEWTIQLNWHGGPRVDELESPAGSG